MNTQKDQCPRARYTRTVLIGGIFAIGVNLKSCPLYLLLPQLLPDIWLIEPQIRG